MNNEFFSHKRSDRIKWIIAAIAILLVAVMVIGLCLQLFGKGKAKPSEWFDKTEQTTSDNQPDNEQSGSIIGDSESNGIRLMSVEIPQSAYGDYGISPMSVETAYTVTASFEPEGTTETGITWTLDWGSKQGVWNGDSKGNVTDFVGLSPAGMTATVTLKKAFGTQIILKAASQNHPDINASLTIDYILRPGTMGDIDYSDNKAITLNINDDSTSLTSGYELLPASGNSSGTISGKYTVKSAVFEPVDYHLNSYTEFSKANSLYKGKGYGDITVNTSIKLTIESVNEFRGHIKGLRYKDFYSGKNGPGLIYDDVNSYLKAALVKAAQGNSMGKITFTVEYAYEDYYSTTLTCSVGVKKFDVSSITVAPTAVNLNQSGLLF